MEKDDDKTNELRKRVNEEPDFINSKRYDYSLRKYKDKNEKEAPDNIIAYFLCMTPQEVTDTYNSAVEKARRFMKLDL